MIAEARIFHIWDIANDSLFPSTRPLQNSLFDPQPVPPPRSSGRFASFLGLDQVFHIRLDMIIPWKADQIGLNLAPVSARTKILRL